MSFVVKSRPRDPGAKALLGDYAVQQNTNDRSQSTLNDVMDQRFKPQHDLWSPLWARQKQAESLVTEWIQKRDAANLELDAATAEVLRALEYTQGKNSAVIKQYIPGSSLAITRRPFDKQLSEQEPYAQAIAQAPDSVIPAETRARFANAFAGGKTGEAELAKAEKQAVDAQRARAARDSAWKKEYEAYHRAVEFVANGDRGVIRTWLREWPKVQAKGTSSSKGGTSSTTGTPPAAGTSSTAGTPPAAGTSSPGTSAAGTSAAGTSAAGISSPG